MSKIKWRTASAVASLCLPFVPAYGQETSAANETVQPADPQETTSIGTGASDAGPIVATARRRGENAQRVPVAVSVVGGEHIDNTGSFNVGRLQQLTPTLQFYSSNPRNTAVNIRGLGSPFGLTNDGIDQGVGIYVDDVYNARVASATFDFLDVARIEVLRGPQGTLYGKNTGAGAIAITTRQPSFTLQGKAEVSVGNYGFVQAKGAVSGPLGESVAARLAVSATRRDGTIFNAATGRYINEQDNLGLRGQVLWEANDTLDAVLALDYSRQQPECCGTVFVRYGPTQRAAARQYPALAASLGYAFPSSDPFDRIADLDAQLQAENEIGGAALRLKWAVAGGTLSSVTAWRFWDWNPANDRDFTGLPVTTVSQNPSHQDQYTQEFRFTRQGDRFDITAGAFGFFQTLDTSGTQRQGSAASKFLLTGALANDPAVLDGLTAENTIGLENASAAIYGQFGWHVTDSITLQPGLRLNYDHKRGSYRSVVTNGQGQLVTFASTDPRIVAQRGVLPPQEFDVADGAWNLSGDFTASWRAAPDVLAYATYARGFKPGGINLNGVPADAAGNPILAAATIKPETIDHFEIGVKTQFADRRGVFNLALFRTDVGDYQALVTNGQLGVLRGYLANAGLVRSQGAEVDLSWRPNERFNFYVTGAFTDARYIRFVDAPCPPELSGGTTVQPGQTPGLPGVPGALSPANCDISGQRLPGVSRWSLSFGGEVNQPAEWFGATDGEVYAGLDGSWRSGFSSNPTPSIYTNVAEYGLLNLRIGWRAKGANLFVWARNLLDAEYFEQLQVASGNTGLIVGNLGEPRTVGLTVAYGF